MEFGATKGQEDRIEEQRQRIQKRLEVQQHRDSSGVYGAADQRSPTSVAEKAVQQSERAMYDLYDDAVDAAKEVESRAAIDEAARSYETQQRERAIEAASLAVASEGEEKECELGLRFDALHRFTVPRELNDALEEQRGQCEEAIAIKEKLLTELERQLHAKEVEYVNLLKKNSAEISELVAVMQDKADDYLHQTTTQLSEVEGQYEKERAERLAQYAEEIQQLVKNRRTREVVYRKRREAKIVESQEKMDDAYETGYERFNATKQGHQGEMYTLREELEKNKADFMLNGERLTYNLQVLRERVKENQAAQAQYKKRITALQDTLAALIARYHETEKRHQRANKDLTAQLQRVVKQYADTQDNFQRFEKADKKKYRQLWKMHDEKCKEHAQRCMQADRVVFEELLGMPWEPPQLQLWPSDAGSMDELEVSDEERAPDVELGEASQMLFEILRLQAPFLVDADVQRAIQAVEGTTTELADMEGILTTLRLKRTEEVEDLLGYFMVDSGEGTMALINPQEALPALHKFLMDRAAKDATMKENTTATAEQRKAAKAKIEKQRKAAEKAYWANMKDVVSSEHLEVWRALQDGLEKYLAQLQQRKHLISTTDTMRAQNQELRELIQQYMHSGINFELYAPPRLLTDGRQ